MRGSASRVYAVAMSQLPEVAGAIALNRFGLGARPDDAPPADPRKWLLGQLDRFDARSPAFAQLPDAAAMAADYTSQLAARRAATRDAAPATMDALAMAEQRQARQIAEMTARDQYRAAVAARMASALATETPFAERLSHFWANHFALSAEKPQVAIYAGAFEADAIRANLTGRFEDMLLAVERHPAMLFYLDQFRSTGPDSEAAARARARQPDRPPPGLNENLAREIMELHTLGVRSGYTQGDVTEFARALTGWSIAGLGPAGRAGMADAAPGDFVFRPAIHQPGTRTIMGRAYAQEGEAQARAVLHDLALAPATARHISTKLARHFVADDPPPALVARMTADFLRTGGDLPSLYAVLVTAPEAWRPRQAKFKSPWEWSVSALRGLGRRDPARIDVAAMLGQLGQPVWKPGSPAGYDDIAASWAAPDALLRRVELAQRFAQGAGADRIDARALAPRLLPGQLGPATATAIAQADNAPTALALLLVSPEFQRR